MRYLYSRWCGPKRTHIKQLRQNTAMTFSLSFFICLTSSDFRASLFCKFLFHNANTPWSYQNDVCCSHYVKSYIEKEARKSNGKKSHILWPFVFPKAAWSSLDKQRQICSISLDAGAAENFGDIWLDLTTQFHLMASQYEATSSLYLR